MEPHQFLLVLLALIIVATDILIRLRVAAARRDGCVESFLEALSPVRASASEKSGVGILSDSAVADSLLKHFAQSFASSYIVTALSDCPRGMTQRELERQFAEVAGGEGRRVLPSSAVRKVIMILMSADIISLKGGKLTMTDPGRALHSLLQSRRKGVHLIRRFQD